jgi:hypothetical protein
MKHYADENNIVFAYEADGSQDHLIGNKRPITLAERDALIEQRKQAEFDSQDYYRKRMYSYPELGEFVDAWVKKDEAALEEYRQKCLSVKAQFPKPEGF